jgi:hypothetical protein
LFVSVSRRYRAPTEDGSILAEPPFAEIGSQIAANQDILNHSTALIDGTPLPQFRRAAIAEVLQAARAYLRECGEPVPDFPDGPLLMSGHQPELTHVGVLVKTFALHGLALQHGLSPLNLIVDNDTTKNTSLRFAALDGPTPNDVHLQTLAYDRFEGEVTYEQRPVLDEQLFRTFAERAAPIIAKWSYRPILPEFWAEMLRQRERTPILGEIVAATRRCWERRWGCRNLEIPLGRLCRTNSFQRFARHIMVDLPRFYALYNECLADYRRRNHIRSRNHPAPDLARDGDVLEAPFWRMRTGTARRSRVMIRPGETPLGSDLRSRALTTTMFLRYVLADGFIHGIGGAKYDEVTDALVERWLGIQAPGFIVVTATQRPPLPRLLTKPKDVSVAQWRVRDFRWNPQRHLPQEIQSDPEVARLVSQKEALIAAEPSNKIERKKWFQELSAVTQRLARYLSSEIGYAERFLEIVRRDMAANQLLMRRDYAWCLFPEELLRDYCRRIMNAG